jgi:hypothetical protein
VDYGVEGIYGAVMREMDGRLAVRNARRHDQPGDVADGRLAPTRLERTQLRQLFPRVWIHWLRLEDTLDAFTRITTENAPP